MERKETDEHIDEGTKMNYKRGLKKNEECVGRSFYFRLLIIENHMFMCSFVCGILYACSFRYWFCFIFSVFSHTTIRYAVEEVETKRRGNAGYVGTGRGCTVTGVKGQRANWRKSLPLDRRQGGRGGGGYSNGKCVVLFLLEATELKRWGPR